MLVSNRFTRILTQSTRTRLEGVENNRLPLSRREPHRGAVVAVQSALSDLNRGYLSSTEVDGYFGSKTAAAVEMFQRDYGLFADGIVGRQTLLQLDGLFSSESYRAPQGRSIHVGVNRLDATHYGDAFPLGACENDARALETVAASLGYQTVVLLTEQATTANFCASVRQAANGLFAGDTLMLTFSGHGSQVVNTSPDEEDDMMDETLCFFDRMLIDDELFLLLGELRAGVQVIAIYDSCHSGTVTKKLEVVDDGRKSARTVLMRSLESSLLGGLPRDIVSEADESGDAAPPAVTSEDLRPIDATHLLEALDGDPPVAAKGGGYAEPQLADAVLLVVGHEQDQRAARGKSIQLFSGIYSRNSTLYDAIKTAVGARALQDVDCHVVALSACQDNQTTLDGTVNGYFTGNILRTWSSGGFSGSFEQFHRRLVQQSTSDMTPALNTYGGPRAQSRLHEKPFVF